VRLFPQLLQYGPNMAGHALRLYAWLQYGSSVVGLAVVLAALGLWLYQAPADRPPPARRLAAPERALWSVLYVALPVMGMLLAGLRPVLRAHMSLFTAWGLGLIAVASMRATALSLLLVSGLIRARLSA